MIQFLVLLGLSAACGLCLACLVGLVWWLAPSLSPRVDGDRLSSGDGGDALLLVAEHEPDPTAIHLYDATFLSALRDPEGW